jgi:hypothetical protein
MAATKRSEAAAGALGADAVRRWVDQAGRELGGGIKASFGRAPTIGGQAGPTWVTMTSATAHGRLVRSADGSTTVTATALPDSTPLLDERHPHTTIAQLEGLVAVLSAARPTTGRA